MPEQRGSGGGVGRGKKRQAAKVDGARSKADWPVPAQALLTLHLDAGVDRPMTTKALYQLAISAAVIGAVALGVFLYQRDRTPGTEMAGSRTEAPTATDQGPASAEAEPAAESLSSSADGEQQATSSTDDAGSGTAQQPEANSELASTQPEAAAPPAPTFDLVRVEPSGETVVAGRSEAGAIIALLSNGKVVGKGVANEHGEFAIVLDEPLPPGAHDVTIEASDSSGDRKTTSEESVAVSVPAVDGEEVLVLLTKPGAASEVLQQPETQGADTPETIADASKTPGTEPDRASASETGAAVDTPGETDAPADEETVVSALSNEATVPQSAAVPDKPGNEAVASETAEALPETDRPPPAGETAAEPAGEAMAAVEGTSAEAERNASSSEMATPEPSGDGAPPRVTVDAVEAENDKLFVAGAGEPDSDVRVYVDNQLIGSARTGSDGRWLLEADKKIEAGEVDVRADQVGDEQGKVVARSEVTFEHAENEIVLRPVAVSGEGSGSLGVGLSADGRPVANIIIRRGDNLWRISRRLYGKGIRYTTIYRANDSQIRDPNLIYPGQVFMLPERDADWSEPAN